MDSKDFDAPPSRPIRVAVVGGGLSGLATATHLLQKSPPSKLCEVTVLEASDRLGGVIHTEREQTGVGEFIVDHGADMFASTPSAALDLCRGLGVESQLLRPKPEGRGAMIARGNRLIPIPEGFVLMRPTKLTSMMTTSLLSPSAKLRLLFERFIPKRDVSVPDESVGSFVRRRLGEECLNNLVAPLVAGIYTADVEKLSMAATMRPIWEMEQRDGSLASATLRRIRKGEDSTERGSSGARYEQFRAFPGGMIELIQTLAQRIGGNQIRLNQPVTSLVRCDDGIRVEPLGQTFDRIVLSTPAPVTARLLGEVSPTTQAAKLLSGLEFASTAIVVMALPRASFTRLPTTFGFVVPPKENRAILAGSFASEKFAGRAPDDHVIVRSFVGGTLQPEMLERRDDQLVDLVRKELGDFIGMDQNRPLDQLAPLIRVVRWNQAMPQYTVGHLDRVAQIHEAMEQIPGIELTTNALDGVGIAPLIASASKTAERIL